MPQPSATRQALKATNGPCMAIVVGACSHVMLVPGTRMQCSCNRPPDGALHWRFVHGLVLYPAVACRCWHGPCRSQASGAGGEAHALTAAAPSGQLGLFSR